MNTNLYIERNLIDEYAYKSIKHGFSLDISDIPKNEIENFMDFLFANHEGFRDTVLDYMQELINQRLPLYECEYKYNAGFVPVIDRVNGESYWVRRA